MLISCNNLFKIEVKIKPPVVALKPNKRKMYLYRKLKSQVGEKHINKKSQRELKN